MRDVERQVSSTSTHEFGEDGLSSCVGRSREAKAPVSLRLCGRTSGLRRRGPSPVTSGGLAVADPPTVYWMESPSLGTRRANPSIPLPKMRHEVCSRTGPRSVSHTELGAHLSALRTRGRQLGNRLAVRWVLHPCWIRYRDGRATIGWSGRSSAPEQGDHRRDNRYQCNWGRAE